MDDKTEGQKQVSKRDKRTMIFAVVFCLGCLVYLTMLSPGPKVYSIEEIARAKKACNDDDRSPCFGKALKDWRKANPDGPWGSRP